MIRSCRRAGATGAALVLAVVLTACGHGSVRTTQDWSGVTDTRLYRTCHVTNHGSGVCIANTDDGLYVLANAHVVGRATSVPVHLVSPHSGKYERHFARVVARSHRTKVDCALLLVTDAPRDDHFLLKLARPLESGEHRQGVDIMLVTAPDKPLVWSGGLVEHSVLWAGPPDESGKTTYDVPMACLYGGIRQANSGSPVFDGDYLVGLNEISLFSATLETQDDQGQRQGNEVQGIGISVPQRIEGFLTAAGFGHLIEQGPPRAPGLE